MGLWWRLAEDGGERVRIWLRKEKGGGEDGKG